MTKIILGALLMASTFPSARAAIDGACPRVDLGETAADCPYAEVVRGIDALPQISVATVDATVAALVPDLHERIQEEAEKSRGALRLWGRSLNFDEGVKAKIIRDEVVDFLIGAFAVAPREGKLVHAGVEHTYGYLFSNLRTAYGYKRLRWVAPDFDDGFGLKAGTLGPKSKSGGFLANVTTFAGRIAFRAEPAALTELSGLKDAAVELRCYNYAKLNVRRLEETLHSEGRTVILRTDFVEFPGVKGANAEALIYSVVDSNEGFAPKLISMFPVAADFAARALDSKGLGPNEPIITRYNAYVAGITDSSAKFTGRRRVITGGLDRNPNFEKHCH